jgi:uncharacterized protein (TIGR03067 family)
MRAQLWVALAVGLLVAADAPKDDAATKELKKLDGTWKLVSGEADGQVFGDDDLKGASLVMNGNKHMAKVADQTFDGTHKVDPTKKPKTIDSTDGDNTMLGIYRLDGDELTICVAGAGKDRPTEFTGKAGSGQVLLVWKRAKK